MFHQSRNASAYAQVSMQTQVDSASPHKLITLLFEGAISAIEIAKLHMERGETAQRGKAISHAIDIVSNGLKVSLNLEDGGELAQRLQALYDYIVRRLLTANLHNDLAALTEARELLSEIHSAWIQIGPQVGE